MGRQIAPRNPKNQGDTLRNMRSMLGLAAVAAAVGCGGSDQVRKGAPSSVGADVREGSLRRQCHMGTTVLSGRKSYPKDDGYDPGASGATGTGTTGSDSTTASARAISWRDIRLFDVEVDR